MNLLEMKEKYGDERRSVIEYAGGDLSMEDMIPNEKVVITISNARLHKKNSFNLNIRLKIEEELVKEDLQQEMKIF